MSSGALPGFRDFYPEELARRTHIFRAWRAVAQRYAFAEYDGPPLEPLDLYTKKSGDEIVGQLYAFTDKGGREVSLRPEMTPTLARMVGARASALRKPVKWFSIPQLFRYERAQRGRLREHFQLNVDIVGEASEVADAELLAFVVDVMRELGLTEKDVRVKVSDREVLNALLYDIGVGGDQQSVVYSVLDKVGRESREVSSAKLARAGLSEGQIANVLGLVDGQSHMDTLGFNSVIGEFRHPNPVFKRFQSLLSHCTGLGIRDWIDVDFSIVRGLAYYTGTVFELFDAKGQLRAICGGGRYDTLLKALGGTDLPALGFGMGDVVLGELLTERGLWPESVETPADFHMVAGNGAVGRPYSEVLRLITALRGAGFSVHHGMNAERYLSQATRNQVENARKGGATAVIYFREDGAVEAMSLLGKISGAATHAVDAAAALKGDAAVMQDLRQWLTKTLRS